MATMADKTWIWKVLRRIGVGALAVILLASVALHLYGRFCFARATAELEKLLGKELVFDFSHLETSTLPKEQNAAQRLLEGTRALKLSDSERRRLSEAWHLARHEWSPDLERSIRTLIAHHRAGLEILHEVATLERSSFGIKYPAELGTTRPPDLAILHIARLLNVEGRLALADGDIDRTLDAAAALAQIATFLQNEPIPITLSIALSVERSLNHLVFRKPH